MNAALVTRNLVKVYGRKRALDGFTLSVPAGATLGLIGRNGAGKTTWMMTVAGYVLPTSGEIDLLGRGPFDATIHHGQLGILPQDSDLPLEARPGALLVQFGRLQGLSATMAAAEAQRLLAAFNLKDKANSPIKTLSHGMRKRVMVAQAFLGHPELVLLDEPLSGLDPVEQERMRAFIRGCRGKTTMVISSHQLVDLERLCTHVAFITAGKVDRAATMAELTSASGRVSYRIGQAPNLAEIQSLDPQLVLTWHEETLTLVVDYPRERSAQAINSCLLPHLLSCGIEAVTPGRSLEEAMKEI